MAAVGMLAGVAVAVARVPLHLPGHKAVLWMTPLLAARLLTRARWGTLVGALAAVGVTTLVGGRLAGGAAGVPFVLAAVATAGNLLCFVGRAMDPSRPLTMFSAGPDAISAAASHAAFGAVAGLAGAAVGLVVRPGQAARQ